MSELTLKFRGSVKINPFSAWQAPCSFPFFSFLFLSHRSHRTPKQFSAVHCTTRLPLSRRRWAQCRTPWSRRAVPELWPRLVIHLIRRIFRLTPAPVHISVSVRSVSARDIALLEMYILNLIIVSFGIFSLMMGSMSNDFHVVNGGEFCDFDMGWWTAKVKNKKTEILFFFFRDGSFFN